MLLKDFLFKFNLKELTIINLSFYQLFYLNLKNTLLLYKYEKIKALNCLMNYMTNIIFYVNIECFCANIECIFVKNMYYLKVFDKFNIMLVYYMNINDSNRKY